MSEVVLIVVVGTALLLGLGIFIAFMTLYYQKRRLEYQRNLKDLSETYQKEVLKAQIEMQEQTLLSISQELHDNVGQTLSLVRLNMSTLEEMEVGAALPKISSSKGLLDAAIGDLRHLSKLLNSNYISQQTLTSLLSFHLDLIQKTGAFETSFRVEGQEIALDAERKLIILRIAQECMNNIMKHAEATTIKVHLGFSAERLSLKVEDNGKGFPSPGFPSRETEALGMGIHNMRFRARMIGGTLQMKSEPVSGTQVLLDLPLI